VLHLECCGLPGADAGVAHEVDQRSVLGCDRVGQDADLFPGEDVLGGRPHVEISGVTDL
jgi:hypothetical protein